MRSFDQGDIIRVPFPYTDRAVRQHRPALVVSLGGIGENRALLWVAMITSATNRSWPDDISFGESFVDAGLPSPSIVRPCKLATIESRHAERLGRIVPELMVKVVDSIRRYVAMDPHTS